MDQRLVAEIPRPCAIFPIFASFALTLREDAMYQRFANCVALWMNGSDWSGRGAPFGFEDDLFGLAYGTGEVDREAGVRFAHTRQHSVEIFYRVELVEAERQRRFHRRVWPAREGRLVTGAATIGELPPNRIGRVRSIFEARYSKSPSHWSGVRPVGGQQGLPVRAARQPDHVPVPVQDRREEERHRSELHQPTHNQSAKYESVTPPDRPAAHT